MENREKEDKKNVQPAKTEERREREMWYDLRKPDLKRHAHACSKSELAQRYLPRVKPATARRTMRAWIEKCPELKEALLKSGYTDKGILLTPVQVQLHYDFLGEP